MKLGTITLTNYGSFFGTHTFPLSGQGLCLVTGDNQDDPRADSNGSGKSTTFDALDWCLFGRIPREDHVDSVINEEAGRDCEVQVELEDDNGDAILVRRYRKLGGKTSGLMVMRNRDELTSLDDAETQKTLDGILGLDRDTFHAAVLFGQTDLLRFADAKDAARLETVTKILQLGAIDEYLERAKAKMKALRESEAGAQGELARARAHIESYEGQIPALRANASRYDDERAEKLREATVQLNGHLGSIEAQKAIVAHEARVKAMEQESMTRVQHTVLDTSEFRRRIEALEAEKSAVTLELGSVRAEGDRLRKAQDRFAGKREGVCSECGQLITADHVDREVAKISVELDTLRSRWSDLSGKPAQFDAQIANLRAQEAENVALHYEADKENNRIWMEIQAQLKQIEDAKAYIAKAEEHAVYLRSVMADTQAKPNPYMEQEATLLASVADLRVTVAALGAAEAERQSERDHYDFWVTGFGPQGLKNYILDSRLGEMTDAANQWIHLLTGGVCWVKFETQRAGRSTKTLSNKLTIRVFRYNRDGSVTERNYASWSGGEKQRVSLGIDFGLTRLIAKRAAKQYDVLILDELFRHLDRSGREAVIDLLQVLNREKGSVIVVDHDAEFKDAFENRRLVRKTYGRSYYVENASAEAESSATESVNPVQVDAPTIQPSPKPVKRKRKSRSPATLPGG